MKARKSELRKIFFARRNALSPEERFQKDTEISTRVKTLF